MSVTPELIAMTIHWEGFKALAFWDRHQWTVGYGCKAFKGETITRDQALVRMIGELHQADIDLDDLFDHKHLPDLDKSPEGTIRRACLVSMIHSMGPGESGFGGFHALIRATDVRDWDQVAWEVTNTRLPDGGFRATLFAQQTGNRAHETAKMLKDGKWHVGKMT